MFCVPAAHAHWPEQEGSAVNATPSDFLQQQGPFLWQQFFSSPARSPASGAANAQPIEKSSHTADINRNSGAKIAVRRDTEGQNSTAWEDVTPASGRFCGAGAPPIPAINLQ